MLPGGKCLRRVAGFFIGTASLSTAYFLKITHVDLEDPEAHGDASLGLPHFHPRRQHLSSVAASSASDPQPTTTTFNARMSNCYERLAPCEDLVGINVLRRLVLSSAFVRGNVLEVGAGTGMNLPHYRVTTPQSGFTHVSHTSEASSEPISLLKWLVPDWSQLLEPLTDDATDGAGSSSSIITLPYCERIVLTDGSSAMVASARTRVARWWPTQEPLWKGHEKGALLPVESANDVAARSRGSPPKPPVILRLVKPPAVEVLVAQAEALPFKSAIFDTVVDTFGLCCYRDPVAALQEMARVCKPGRTFMAPTGSEQPTGSVATTSTARFDDGPGHVVLLEHGRGSSSEFNWYLDRWAARHAARWGCWWNRDVADLVRESGSLEVILERSYFFGTLRVIVARPLTRPHRGDPPAPVKS